MIQSTVTQSGYCLGDDRQIDRQDGAIQDEVDGGAKTMIYFYLRVGPGMRGIAIAGPITLFAAIICVVTAKFSSSEAKT